MSEPELEMDSDPDFDDLAVPDGDVGDSSPSKGLVIPFRTIHSPPQHFKMPNRTCFIPGKPISHGDYEWVVKRRYKHFQHLHQQLQLFRATLSIPFPTRTHRERRSTFKDNGDEKNIGLPRFPKKPEALVGHEHIDDRKKILELYLQNLVQVRSFRNHHETLEFFEVSHLSFVNGLGQKGKEGVILKRAGQTHARRVTCGLCSCFSLPCLRMQRVWGDCCGHWQKRWLIVKDTFLAYVRPKDGKIHCVMLFDSEFEVSSGLYDLGEPHGLILKNSSRHLVVKCWTKRRCKEWTECFKKVQSTSAAKAFLGPNRFSSFAPMRPSTTARWYVDGASYMSAVADALEAAQEEIFIADWWLSPEIYMKRPVVEGERWRLDKILQRKAKEGVKIFVLLYKEVNLALGINSFYSKQKLVEQHHENIKVLRHPDHVSAGVFLWAHHEKLVVIDQNYAFVGGIDLCYGRWDDQLHRLTDLGSVSKNQASYAMMHIKKNTSSKPGGANGASSIMQLAIATNAVTVGTVASSVDGLDVVDDSQQYEQKNPAKVTFSDPELSINIADTKHLTATKQMSEISLNDVGIQAADSTENVGELRLKGETPPSGRRDLLIRKVTKVSRGLRDDSKEWIGKHLRRRSEDSSSDNDETEGKEVKKWELRRAKSTASSNNHVQVTKSKSESALSGLQGSCKLWIGKDYTNFIVKDFVDLESPFTDLVDRNTTPRMPWHDIASMVEGAAAKDVARHFIQRWNAAKDEKAKVNQSYPFLLPKAYDDNDVSPIFSSDSKCSKVTSQVVRSASHWSAGMKFQGGVTEDSLMQAYIDSIENSKHYVYIENQFFVSLAAPKERGSIQNRVCQALCHRILQAHREKKKFRVFVILPLLPGFEGEVGTNRGIAIHAITHYNYSSICRGGDSLLARLQKEGIDDPSEYVTFHGLRTHSELLGDLITELIYVHSKLMIVDDNLVIVGSANINDRSMLGSRDSEVAVVYQDEEYVHSKMNGQDYKAGKFAYSLRTQLFREHLGLLRENDYDLMDPISDEFYRGTWLKQAELNTEIFDEVFRCIPSDKCRNFVLLREYQNETSLSVTDPSRARKVLQKVKGYLVMLPLKFLCESDLLPATGTREALMPSHLWT